MGSAPVGGGFAPDRFVDPQPRRNLRAFFQRRPDPQEVDRPGDVVARNELLRVLPGHSNDPHAVDTAVLRLRTALGDKNIVATVVKRGYRLAIDEPLGAA